MMNRVISHEQSFQSVALTNIEIPFFSSFDA